ncbi:hypothetical protein C2857_000762 [Epichloe festucae Fl1]|uniref:Uncharacterized protein n=1 Tax=Epichloe festucae (strain Fl1) TaxID=877507 RepID=A0A7S9KN27_EPIFF|nr:hypothetical protein C2857_000762 [Epichloe festucae Fl1]
MSHLPSASRDKATAPAEADVGMSDRDDEPPAGAQGLVERWNRPRSNLAKLGFACLSAAIAGMNDAAVGVRISEFPCSHSIEIIDSKAYDIYDLGFDPIRYSLAAVTNARIHVSLGRRGVAVMAPLCHIVTYAVLASHPAYPALVVANAIGGFGNGLTDACFCAWVGAMDKANAIQGVFHACYSLGALFAPLIATSMVVKAELMWWSWYYVMAGMTLGRALLGFVTERFGERLCLTIYLAICVGLELLFWLVPLFVVSAAAVAFLGFFLGPMFPGAVMMTVKLLPKKIHVSAIGFAMALGGTGADCAGVDCDGELGLVEFSEDQEDGVEFLQFGTGAFIPYEFQEGETPSKAAKIPRVFSHELAEFMHLNKLAGLVALSLLDDPGDRTNTELLVGPHCTLMMDTEVVLVLDPLNSSSQPYLYTALHKPSPCCVLF